MNLTEKINELKNSDSIVKIKNGKSIELPHPQEVLNHLENLGQLTSLDLTKPQSNAVDDQISTAYNNYLIIVNPYTTSQIDDEHLGHHQFKLGIVVGNASNKVTVFSGMEAAACANMCVWADNKLSTNHVDINWIQTSINKLYQKRQDDVNRFIEFRERLSQKVYSDGEYLERIGQLALDTIETNTYDYFKHGMEIRNNANYPHYINMEQTDYKLYNLLTDRFKRDGSIASKVDKVQKITTLFA